MGRRPEAVGLSIQFQHRALEFLGLAAELRQLGYEGHVTCGGQFPTLAAQDVLLDSWGVDSVVTHEGEESFVELLGALSARRPVAEIPGLVVRTDDGAIMRTPTRCLLGDLDQRPFPARYRAHARHVGIPFIPVMGGRGCWGACSYCSITSFYRDAKQHGGGRMLRHRSADNIADEMALLVAPLGGQAIFCFHDDNFLLPKPEASLERVRAIRDALDARGVGKIGLIGKCRPDSLTPELARELRALGVLRLYVGVENAAQRGADHLGRRSQAVRAGAALDACRDAGIFVCYNLLLFEPDATLADIEENLAFVRSHGDHPMNFCRAEPYFGTPLELDLRDRPHVDGSYLGYNYRIQDDDTELLFRICAAAFRQRNFDALGVANRNMGLGYSLKMLEHFYDDPDGKGEQLARSVRKVSRAITMETADFLGDALDIVRRHRGDHERVVREAALLGLRIAAADATRHAQLDDAYAAMERHAERAKAAATPPTPSERLARFARRAAIGATMVVGAACGNGSNGPGNGPVVDPPPPDQPVKMVPIKPNPHQNVERFPPNDPVPNEVDPQIVDPAPIELRPHPPPPDPVPRPIDPPPPDPVPYPVEPQPRDPVPHPIDVRRRFPPPDPVPRPIPGRTVDPAPRPMPPPHVDSVPTEINEKTSLIDQWRETSIRVAARTTDLPLWNPPRIALAAERQDGTLVVRITGGGQVMSLRWEGDGRIETVVPSGVGVETADVDGTVREVRWRPALRSDQIRVAVRMEGGIAVAALRHGDVPVV